MSGKDYAKIGNAFNSALEGYVIEPAFSTAIHIMQTGGIKPWDEMVWLCVEQFLNELSEPMSEEAQGQFEYACALLESNT